MSTLDYMSDVVKIDVWSDVACPWCYIGKRKLEAAIESFESAGGKVNVEYHSYLLNPEMPEDFEGGQRDYLAKHKGLDLGLVDNMSLRIKGIAESLGLHYDFDNQIMTNTGLAHQLIHFAKTRGLQAEMKERLLKAHFVEALHVGKLDTLVELATQVGLNPDEVRQALTEGEFATAVQEDIDQARAYGITGVPFFVIQNKYGISGAQDSAVLLSAMQQANSEN